MRLFNKPKPEPKPERTSYALLDLQERMDRLERVVRDIRTDWEAQYDKFHRLNMRLAKRIKTAEDLENGSDTAETAHEDAPGRTNATPRIQNPLAEQLLRRGRIA